MKKSEMVALIKKELDKDDLSGDLTWVAEHIVCLCERAGMLPPKNYNLEASTERRSRNDMAHWEPSHEWESESS